MIYKVTWGQLILQSSGFSKKRSSGMIKGGKEFGIRLIEEDNLTNVKRKATRIVNACPKTQWVLRNLPNDRKRWYTWKPDIDGEESIDQDGNSMRYTSKQSKPVYGQGTPVGTHLIVHVTISWARLEPRDS